MRGHEKCDGDLADIEVNMDNVAYVMRAGDTFSASFVGGERIGIDAPTFGAMSAWIREHERAQVRTWNQRGK